MVSGVAAGIPLPSAAAAVRLASIATHAAEAISNGGHPADIQAIEGLLTDAEVQAYLGQLRSLALLPVPRG